MEFLSQRREETITQFLVCLNFQRSFCRAWRLQKDFSYLENNFRLCGLQELLMQLHVKAVSEMNFHNIERFRFLGPGYSWPRNEDSGFYLESEENIW